MDNTFVKQFVDVLMKLPVTETFKGRSSLLNGLPAVSLNRSEDLRRLDLNLLIEQLDRLGRVKSTGVRPLIILAENALSYAEEWDGNFITTLKDIIQELDHYYGGEIIPTPLSLPDPEALVFNGRDERLSLTFLERAIRTARSVARLQVPRFFHGEHDGSSSFGTGWLIAPGLLITNHHVITARDAMSESPANISDLQVQAEHVIAWFDYLKENGPRSEYRGAALVSYDKRLDYALIRLKDADEVEHRPPLPLIQRQPVLRHGTRLNIAQHPQGGPLLYAIRSNFYVDTANAEDFLRYLTDTEPGSSGSPVLDDSWRVVALHHASASVSPKLYDMRMQGMSEKEVVRYNNEGVAIHSILANLPEEVKQEINRAQGLEV